MIYIAVDSFSTYRNHLSGLTGVSKGTMAIRRYMEQEYRPKASLVSDMNV